MMIVIALFISSCEGVLRDGGQFGGVVGGGVAVGVCVVTFGEVLVFGDVVVSGPVVGAGVVAVGVDRKGGEINHYRRIKGYI